MAVAAGAVPNWPRIRFYIRSAGDSVDWGQDVLLLSFRLASSSSSWLPTVRIYFSNAKSKGTGEGPSRSHGEWEGPQFPRSNRKVSTVYCLRANGNKLWICNLCLRALGRCPVYQSRWLGLHAVCYRPMVR